MSRRSDSGSSSPPMPVKPTTSDNKTVTTLRVWDPIADWGRRDAPQDLQACASDSFSNPQTEQMRWSVIPQVGDHSPEGVAQGVCRILARLSRLNKAPAMAYDLGSTHRRQGGRNDERYGRKPGQRG